MRWRENILPGLESLLSESRIWILSACEQGIAMFWRGRTGGTATLLLLRLLRARLIRVHGVDMIDPARRVGHGVGESIVYGPKSVAQSTIERG